MNFSENLISLRKKNNMNQEYLANKLNVTRQTIYKWETGITYPDMDKLVDLSKIFDITLDELVNGEIHTSNESIVKRIDSDYSKNDIIKKVKNFSLALSISIFFVLLNVSIFLLLTTINFPNREIFSILILVSMILLATLVIIVFAVKLDNFIEDNDLAIDFSRKELAKASSLFTVKLVLGIAFVFIGVLVVLISTINNDEKTIIYGASIMLNLIGIGLAFIINSIIMISLYKEPRKFLKYKKKE